MNYKLTEILGFKDEKVSIEVTLNRYFQLCTLSINGFKEQLDEVIKTNNLYTYPSSNFKIAKNFKLLTISAFLICYEITNNDIFTLNCQQFIDNNKFVTPDVFFYSFVMINEVLERIKNNKWSETFKDLIEKIDAISKVESRFFQVNLPVLKEFHITNNFFDEEFDINNPINDSIEDSNDEPIHKEELVEKQKVKKSTSKKTTVKKTLASKEKPKQPRKPSSKGKSA